MTRAESKAATRAHVLTTASRLFSRFGYGAVTMRQIATAAKTSTGAIFANWKDKEALHAEASDGYGRAWRIAELTASLRGREWSKMDDADKVRFAHQAHQMLEKLG